MQQKSIVRKSILGICSILFGFAMLSHLDAEEPAKEIDKLIAELVSPNTPPKIIGEEEELEGNLKNYDHAAQDRIYRAADALISKGTVAFPMLIAHMNDRRYSVTHSNDIESARHHAGYWNYTVGEVCRDIVLSQILAAFPKYSVRGQGGPGRDPEYVPFNTRDPLSAKKWWQDRTQKSLAELQIEILEASIERERKRGFKDLRQEAEILGPLQYVLNRIHTTKRAVPADPYHSAARL